MKDQFEKKKCEKCIPAENKKCKLIRKDRYECKIQYLKQKLEQAEKLLEPLKLNKCEYPCDIVKELEKENEIYKKYVLEYHDFLIENNHKPEDKLLKLIKKIENQYKKNGK